MKKMIALTTALFTFSLLFSGCSAGKDQSKIDQIKKAGKIVMYTNAEFPPYEFVENNEVVGVDVEIAKSVADKLGVKLEIFNTNFEGICASIGSGKGDIGLSGITINEARKEQVDFSNPYIDSIQYIILPEESDIQFMEDLAGKTIGGQTGTTGTLLVESEIQKGVLKDKSAQLKHYNSAPIAMQDLKTKRIEAVVIDEIVAIQIANGNPGYKAIPFKYAEGNPVTEQFGVAIAKGNEDLLAVINEAVDEMVTNGKIQELIEQYTR